MRPQSDCSFFPPPPDPGMLSTGEPCDFSLLKTFLRTERLRLSAGGNFLQRFQSSELCQSRERHFKRAVWHDPIDGSATDESIRRIRWIRRFRPAHPIDHSFDFLVPAL